MELEGVELVRARLLDERESRLFMGVGFVYGCVFGSFAILTSVILLRIKSPPWVSLLAVPAWFALVGLLWAISAAWLAGVRRRIARRTLLRSPDRPRVEPRHFLYGVGGLISVYAILIVSIAISDRDLGTLVGFGAILLQLVGLGGSVLIYMGLFGVRGNEPRCAKCGYVAGKDPDCWHTCPECGSDLRAPFGVVLGVRTRRWWLVVVGTVLVWSPFVRFLRFIYLMQ